MKLYAAPFVFDMATLTLFLLNVDLSFNSINLLLRGTKGMLYFEYLGIQGVFLAQHI